MASEVDFQHNQEERAFLRVSVYLLRQGNIIDLLSPQNPRHTMEKRGIRVESYIDKDTYDVCTRVVGLSERLIVTANDFDHLLQDAF